jgi:lactate dehydrogenase-like 2-hydroxyacid dehydrogenase
MKVKAFSTRPDEDPYYDLFSKKYDLVIVRDTDGLTMENIDSVKGYEGLSLVLDGNLTDEVLKALADRGVKYIGLRTIGFDGINLKLARDLGIRISHAAYSPYSVANYTVMLMLMCIRKALYILLRSHTADDSLGNVQGMEMQNMTVGVIGTGRIGKAVIQNLSGFGCKIIAYDIHPSDIPNVEYVPLDELYHRSDIITLHTFLSPETRHMLNSKAFAKMKDGVIIINAARGALIDSSDLIDAIESGKVGGAGIDCFEGEEEVVRMDHLYDDRVKNHDYIVLKSFQNTIVSPHVAFYTDQAVSDMVRTSLESLKQFGQGETVPLEVTTN